MTILLGLFALLLGIVIGGIVNALADYLPPQHEAALAADDEVDAPPEIGEAGAPSPTPPLTPHYPDGTRRPVAAWLGIAAFITGNRASSDGASLPWRHPVVEVFLGLAYAVLVLTRPGDLQLVFHLLFLAILTLITVIDIEHKLILFVVIVPSCLLAILASILVPAPPPNLQDALVGGAAGFGIFFLMFLGGILFSVVTGTDEIAFGFGDVMLGILSGLLLGWQALILALPIIVVAGALVAMLYMLSKLVSRTQYAMFTALPYGPYIVIGTIVMMLWREEVRSLLLR
jgi:leader peptidase (prepilin peptidase)/N-methyltransferase